MINPRLPAGFTGHEAFCNPDGKISSATPPTRKPNTPCR